MRANRILLAGLAVCIGLGLPAIARADGKKGTATIKGKVVLDTEPKKLAPINMSGVADCHALNKDKKPPTVPEGDIVYKSEGNAVPYAFIHIKKGITDKYDPPAEPMVLDQKDCMYHPHVWGMIAGQEMVIKNSDKLNHNVHSLASKNPQFNFAQPQPMEKKLGPAEKFTKPELAAKIKCDVHSWMSSYAFVMTHPFFAVSKSHKDTENKDERGTFVIKDVPAGEYELECWHESWGVVTQNVTVKDGETVEVTFKVGGKKAQAPYFGADVELAKAGAPAQKPACCDAKAGHAHEAAAPAVVAPAADAR